MTDDDRMNRATRESAPRGGPAPDAPPAAGPTSDAVERCDWCGSADLWWRNCKLLCRNCSAIVKSCADL
jgi:hypothetical protein